MSDAYTKSEQAADNTRPINTVDTAALIRQYGAALGPLGIAVLAHLLPLHEGGRVAGAPQQIGDAIGAGRSTVIRELKRLEQMGHIRRVKTPGVTYVSVWQLSAACINLTYVKLTYVNETQEAPAYSKSEQAEAPACINETQAEPEIPVDTRAPMRSSRKPLEEPKELSKTLPDVEKKKQKTRPNGRRQFRPEELPERVFALYCRIALLRWKLDNVPADKAPEIAETAAWLVDARDATPEQFDDWLRWWWHDPDSLGFRQKTRPWPKNVRNTWDTAFLTRPAPQIAEVVPIDEQLTPAMRLARQKRAAVQAELERERAKERRLNG